MLVQMATGVVCAARRSAGPGSDLQMIAIRFVGTLGLPMEDSEQRLRVLLALQLVVNASMSMLPGFDVDLDRSRLRTLIVELATGVIGPQADGQ